MAFQHKPGQGTLFQNEKEPGSRQPILKGTVCTPDGQTWEIACWTVTDDSGTAKRDKNGKPYYSVKLQEPRQRAQSSDSGRAPAREEAPQRQAQGDLDDSVPF